MVEAKYLFKKNQKCLAKILTNFFVSEVFIKNVIYSMLLMLYGIDYTNVLIITVYSTYSGSRK
jgi:hypothetical protein